MHKLIFTKDILLAPCTSFKIGGPAKYFCVVKNIQELKAALKMVKKENLPFFVLGNGSNILVSDEGYKGVVINFQFSIFNFQNTKFIASTGLSLKDLALKSVKAGLTGLEWAVGIPGTVGGGVYGNCGAHGFSISDSIVKIKTLDTDNLKIKNYTNKECRFAYRESIFKKNKEIILEAEFQLKKGDKKEIQKQIEEILVLRKKIPIEPSAGSVFKNPIIKGEKISVGRLIEQCGLKGKVIGGAKIYEGHANFIVNFNNAKAIDVLALIDLCKKEVKKKFSIDLQAEIQFLGF